MDHAKVGKLWDENAEVWTKLARMGYDVYRDYMNTPAFLAMLPEVAGLKGLDIGCGEGNNTRLVARRGAKMTAVDISRTFIGHARQMEAAEPLGIDYQVASAAALPFESGAFDFAISTMCFMDVPDHEGAVREAYRVLKPGGFLQFSITHPCFFTPRFRPINDEAGNRVAIECGDYFHSPENLIQEWIFGAAPMELKRKMKKFKVPVFYRTLSSWLNLLISTGFILERIEEPFADDEAIRRCPDVADTRIVAYFLHIRGRKGK